MTVEPFASFERARRFYTPYFVARPPITGMLRNRPMGFEVPSDHLFDPLKIASADFVTLVHRLHARVCGPFGMPMEPWVQYDCALMPGLTFGLGHPAKDLPRAIRKGLEVGDDYDGPVPLSVGMAIPLPDRKTWVLYSIGSLDAVAPGTGPAGLLRLTLALGTAALGVPEVISILRWRSPLLGVLAGLGPLRLITAWTPAHDHPDTVTVSVRADDEGRRRLMRGVGVDEGVDEGVDGGVNDRFVDADDTEGMRRLQDEIEAGEAIHIVGPARDEGTRLLLPIRKSSRRPSDAVALDGPPERGDAP